MTSKWILNIILNGVKNPTLQGKPAIIRQFLKANKVEKKRHFFI